ncbi:(2Fe-2S)-binding protein [Mycoplasmatota bacterium WC44]
MKKLMYKVVRGKKASEQNVICVCKNVSKEEIKEAINNGAKTIDEIANKTGATTGCGLCEPIIKDILRENQ